MATAGSKFVTQNKEKYKKHVCGVLQARRRQQIAHEIGRIEGVMHAVVYVDGTLEAKCARDSSQKRFLKGAWSAQRAKRTSNGATRATKTHKSCYYRGRLGVKLHQRRPQILLRMTMSMLMTILIIMKMMMVV